MNISIYIYRVFKRVKNIFAKRFDVCLHQLILFITHFICIYCVYLLSRGILELILTPAY